MWSIYRLYDGVTSGRVEVRRAAEKHRDSAAVTTQPYQSLLLHECSSSSRAAGPKCHQSCRCCNTYCFYHPNMCSAFFSVWTMRTWLKLLLTVLGKLRKHPVITFSASKLSTLLFQDFAFWTFKYSRNNKAERGSVERGNLFIPWELFLLSIGLGLLPCSSFVVL